MQTLLKVTNANVCASMDVARSFLARTMGIMMVERVSCGKNAADSILKVAPEGIAESRYSRML